MRSYSAIEKYRIIDPILRAEVTMVEVSAEFGIPTRTLRYWKKQFLDQGLSGLERKIRSDRGQYRRISDELLQLTQAMVLQKPALTITTIHQKIKTLAERQSINPPAYGTIYQIVKRLDPALVTLAHQGSKAYQQQYELIYRRECCRPNEIWQADHTLLDIYLLDERGKIRKPWLTVVLDDFSRAVCGYFLSFEEPSALHTALALRQAIGRKDNPQWPICGIPQILYTDHGTDFMSLHIEQVCIRLKIRMVNSRVGRPQGRGKIERFFETINEEVLRPLSGYLLSGKATSRPSLSIISFQEKLEHFFVQQYHHTVHTTTGESPLTKWNDGGFLPQLPDSLQDLDQLLLSVDHPRKVQRDGIRFQGLRYLALPLTGFVGERVTIRYDPRDLAEIRVYHQQQFLCTAVCQDIAKMTVSLKEIQKARKEVREGLYQEIQRTKRLLQSIQQQKAEKRIITASPHKEVLSVKPNPLKRYEND